MLELNDVTLVSIDSVADHYSKNNIRLASLSRIVPNIIDNIKFGDILFINPFNKNSNLIKEEFDELWKLDKEKAHPIMWYSNFVIRKLPFLIKTKYYLIIQWDGFPQNFNRWMNAFTYYPFIGGGHSTNNGGFSLRNTEVMKQMATIDDWFGTGAEDEFYSSFFDNKWMKDRNTPFKIAWPEKHSDLFCNWKSDINTFGWHRSNYSSYQNVYETYRNLGIFDELELNKLAQYCMAKTLPNHLLIDNYMKEFDIDYNEEFFNI
jgi:hypothetical protein